MIPDDYDPLHSSGFDLKPAAPPPPSIAAGFCTSSSRRAEARSRAEAAGRRASRTGTGRWSAPACRIAERAQGCGHRRAVTPELRRAVRADPPRRRLGVMDVLQARQRIKESSACA